ncbi:NUDIX hydrolase [Streptococcus entericus]|uniref:NUDIX hydrolase n=1 Tax=Streptococcus entericus TaxID=155680 RepID=UPI0003658997|nr:NUDIX hydrolase [Streptococcus entericus]
MEFEEKTLHRETIFEGHIFTVAVDDVELPNGLGQAKRELIFHKGAVCVLAVTPEEKIILVKQYRKAIESISYEIPAGKLEVGEAGSEAAAALRELEEETGYIGQLDYLYAFYSAIGFCNEKLTLYLATDLVKVDNPRPKDADETIELLELTYDECMEMVRSGQIVDAKTIIALQHYALTRGGRHG